MIAALALAALVGFIVGVLVVLYSRADHPCCYVCGRNPAIVCEWCMEAYDGDLQARRRVVDGASK